MAEAIETLEGVDPAATLRNKLRHIAKATEEWAGIPFTLEGGPDLIVEPSYPWASIFDRTPAQAEPRADEEEGRIRSTFYSFAQRCEILVIERPNGKVIWGRQAHMHSLDLQLATMASAAVWGIEQEQRALQLLGSMVRHHQFKGYLLTGMFLERSERSGVVYIFRRLRPTIALTERGEGFKGRHAGRLRILAALCLHPIGYYDGSWAGAMCPTDDVVAHLALMRADEHMFWRRSNQHAPHYRQAGI